MRTLTKKQDYYAFLCQFTDELLRICRQAVFINIQKTMYNKADVLRYLGNYSRNIQEVFIWEKTNPMPASGKAVTNAYEFFLYFGASSPQAKDTYTKNILHTAVNDDMPKEHKAVMRQDVADWFIGNFFERGTTCIDCFGGLGTTAIACNKYNIDCTLIEQSEIYCRMAEERIKNNQQQILNL